MSKIIALAPLLSATFSARRKNIRSEGEISPRSGTTTTSPLWTTSRAWAIPACARQQITVRIDNPLFIPLESAAAPSKFDIASETKRAKNQLGKIPSENIEQVAAANDIVEVIGAYFPLKRAGANFKALCPFHQEKTPSFHVSPQRQTFHCFGCGVGGSVFRFVMDYEHTDFPSAVRKLAARSGITVVEKSRGRAADDEERQRELRQRLLKLHAEAAQWFHENLIKREIGEPARKYLKQRGITLEIANRWQLGYAPEEWDAFGSWARARGYDVRDLIASGLIKVKDDTDSIGSPRSVSAQAAAHATASYDRFRGRIMFPICNDVGEVIAFSGRLLQDEEGAAKYLNS